METESCLICSKHRGQAAAPPGGYIYEGAQWMVCHAPIEKGPLGTLFIESRRHLLDFSEFNGAEAASFAVLAGQVYRALRPAVAAERIYQVSMMEGMSHFHAWIVPRAKGISEHGVAFLAKDLTCTEEQVVRLVEELRQAAREW